MKKILHCTLFLFQFLFANAQNTTSVSGTVIDAKTQNQLQGIVVSISNTNSLTTTNNKGYFLLENAVLGNQLLIIRSEGYKEQILSMVIEKNKTLDLGIITLEPDITVEQKQSLISITDSDLGDDNSGSENTASLLLASRDVFSQSAAFNWGQARFRVRGIDNEYGKVMINGIVMNKIYDDRPQYSNWGGLNDALQNQEYTNGSAPSDHNFGGILGTNAINTRASLSRKGNRISTAATNTNYSGRLMATTASGMRTDGWAYTISASRRFANNGYFEGTTYSANSVFASIEKKINSKQSLNLTSIYGQNDRAKNSPNTQEVTNLAGEEYNSYWGYQDGRIRNSRIKTVEEPIFMLSHYWKPNPNTNLTTTVSYQLGAIGNSRLDFQGSNNPDPTYYRNMPSYYTSLFENDQAIVGLNNPSAYLPGGLGGIAIPNLAAANNPNEAKFLNIKQIDWNSMYQANQLGNTYGEGAKYVLYEDRTDDKQWAANSTLASQLSDGISLNAGANFRKLNSHNYKNLLDLLGATHFNDVSLFGIGDQRQSDMNNPNKKVGVGESYGYNYELDAINFDAFTQFKFVFKKVDFYLSQSYSHNDFQRNGLYKNGYYPTNSIGKSNKASYDNFGFKGGITYKITGRQFLNFNGVFLTKAPSLRNVFNNARVNNTITADVSSENVASLDASYIINSPKLKTKLTAFYATIKNQTETSFFFADGLGIDNPNTTIIEYGGSFVAETITGLNKRNMGLEFGLEYALSSTLKVLASAAYGEYIYDNNPTVRLTIDNIAAVQDYGKSNLKNYKQAGTPQAAASLGFEYRDPKFWYVGANINHLANNYIDIAPIMRTENFFVDPNSSSANAFSEATQDRANELLKQEKFDDFSLVNINGGKSWKIGTKYIGINASINNLLNQKYKTGGYEQARNAKYRKLNQDASSGTPSFAPRYFYGYGMTYFINLYLNF